MTNTTAPATDAELIAGIQAAIAQGAMIRLEDYLAAEAAS